MTDNNLPLMRKATAVWLVDNTALSFKQIANFCGFHELEVQGIADGDVAQGIIGQNPIHSGQLTKEEIQRCENDHSLSISINKNAASKIKVTGQRKSKYTPIARRQDKPDGIAFLLKYYPELTNANIRKIVGTTDAMIDSLRDRSHWNMKNIKPRDVVLLELCSQSRFNEIIEKAKASALKAADENSKPKKTKK